jgi:hypothetical protein
MWIALFVSLILYIPLFFWIRGNITVGRNFWDVRFHKRGELNDPDGSRRRAMRMIAYASPVFWRIIHWCLLYHDRYPLVYAVLVLPLSVARWIGFVEEDHGITVSTVPSSATIATLFIFSLSGLANVLLFFLTRPTLLLFGHSRTETGASTPDVDADSIEG